MINIDLRREPPVENVNRILAIESLVKRYPIDLVEEVDPRVIHSWTELDNQDNEIPVKQIDLAFCLFGLPTPEFKHLMHKLAIRVEQDNIQPLSDKPNNQEDGTNIDTTEEERRGAIIRDMIMKS